MAKAGTAGNYGKKIRSDCKVTIELKKKGGFEIELISKVKDYFGDKIVSLAKDELKFFGLKKC